VNIIALGRRFKEPRKNAGFPRRTHGRTIKRMKCQSWNPGPGMPPQGYSGKNEG
jgi:hypothetical protein